MGVAAQFAHREVGALPDNWEVRQLGQLTDCLDRLRVPLNESERRKRRGDIPYCGANGVLDYVDAFVVDDDVILIAEDGGYFDEYETRPIAYRMTGKCWVNNHAHILKAKPGVDQGFVFHGLVHRNILPYLASGTRAKLNRSELDKIPVGIPSRSAEQRAVSRALDDADALLRTLEALLAKKRDLRQAAIQQLLSGKLRMPGFSGEWKEKPFSELFQFLRTANNPRAHLSAFGDVAYIHYGDIHTMDSAFLDCSQTRSPCITEIQVAGVPLVEDGDLVMADASEDYAGIGKAVEVRGVRGRKVVAGLHTFLLRGNRELLADGFKGYVQFIPSFRADMVRLATGISVYGVSKSNVRSIAVRIPEVAEQAAITTALNDMDAEIAALEARRDKTRVLKQGMMQELLTGRTQLL